MSNLGFLIVQAFFVFIVTGAFYFMAIKAWNHSGYKYFLIERNDVQNIHQSKIEIPRFGGILMILSTTVFSFFLLSGPSLTLFLYILICSLPMIIVSSIEDFFHNIRPIVRLLFTLLSCTIFFLYSNITLPLIETPLLYSLINEPWLKYAVLIFLLASVINGMNIIDGTNGLGGMVASTAFISLSIISVTIDDYLIFSISMLFVVLIFSFLIFNYPLGKVFLGDAGAYWLGWSIGIITIVFYGRHPELPSWGASLILFYPSMEVLFSFLRKIISKKNPLKPDENHLHLRLYFLLEKKLMNKSLANNIVMPLLAVVWLAPQLLLLFSYQDINMIIASFLVCIFIYLLVYKLSMKK